MAKDKLKKGKETPKAPSVTAPKVTTAPKKGKCCK